MSEHNIKTLPKWVRELISKQQDRIDELNEDLKMEKLCNKISADKDYNWLTVPNKETETFRLFRLFKDDPLVIVTIRPGDILLIGRKKDTK